MTDFSCVTCQKSFSLSEEVLQKYPGWTPKYCRSCSPKAGGKKSGGRKKPSRKGQRKEENLSLTEVLEKYTEGPTTGIFTDGACSPNPGPGGWGVVIVNDNEVVSQDHGAVADTTNNRMEMMAIIRGLELVGLDDGNTENIIFTDSNLCVQTLNQWVHGWKKNGWKRKTGAIKNLDLVQRAHELHEQRPGITLKHISAHSGYRWNEYADSLATAYSRKVL